MEGTPIPGQWPVDPQDDQLIDEERIWVDGVFDFFHHGHAGAFLQARQLGRELYVGLHSDEACLQNKGPTVMNLRERQTSIDACRWTTYCVPHAPYVTSLPWVDHYGCWYVAHGDDITSDASGEDCYRFVKAAGRFKVFKRTPGISTTDLVGRMLLCTKDHFIKSLTQTLTGTAPDHATEPVQLQGKEMMQRIKDYATDETGLRQGPEVWSFAGLDMVSGEDDSDRWHELVPGRDPQPGQRIVYVDGGFDLFSTGHIEFLKLVNEAEHGAAYVVVGIHDDEVVNAHKGLNYPIMNIYERGLCVLQCRYVHAVVFGAPFRPTESFLAAMPVGAVSAVYHGPTSFVPTDEDPYVDVKELGLYQQIGPHQYQHVNATNIVDRILQGRKQFEERQIRKGQKALVEQAARQREMLEETAKAQQAGNDTIMTS